MITTFDPRTATLSRGGAETLSAEVTWIDLLTPTAEESAAVERLLGIALPTHEEMQEIEASSRLSREADVLVMTAPVLTNSFGLDPRTSAVTFILAGARLVTLRYATPQALATFIDKMGRPAPSAMPLAAGDILIALLETIVDRLADVLERIGFELDALSHRIFHQPTPARPRLRSSARELEATLRTIGRNGDVSSKARDTIMALKRVVAFLPQDGTLHGGAEAKLRIKTIGRDLQSLSEYADFINTKTGFLLDATLGMINIQQNNVIKLFSVMAVLFLPPTLVASIYGMNFQTMPELNWPWGYPLALFLMLLAALAPYWFFKRKGWL